MSSCSASTRESVGLPPAARAASATGAMVRPLPAAFAHQGLVTAARLRSHTRPDAVLSPAAHERVGDGAAAFHGQDGRSLVADDGGGIYGGGEEARARRYADAADVEG